MTYERDPIRQGHYAAKQLHSRDRLISWSHRRRFECGLALAGDLAGQRILDYGCGDGTFLALLQRGDDAPAHAVGAEIDSRIVIDCRRRFAGLPAMRFVDVGSLQDAAETASFDAVFCMEVLEHVVDPMPLLADFARLLRPGGRLVVSVPIETGPSVVVKQIVRRVAGWRGIGDYPGTSSYGPLEIVRSVFAGAQQHIQRPVFPTADGRLFHDHKGFNWRVLRAAVAERFELVRTATSPFDWAGANLSTQAWFVARRRGTGGR
jgi:SAM-dependent methyltransferase